MRYININAPYKISDRTLGINRDISQSRQKRGESNLWQRRFWEHLIRNERDFGMINQPLKTLGCISVA